MERDYAKQYYKRKPKSRTSRKWLMLVAFTLILCLGAGIFYTFYTRHWLDQPGISTFVTKLKSTFGKRPPQAMSANNAKKNLENDPPPVKFSFYNELPNMRVDVSAKQPVVHENLSINQPAEVASPVIRQGYFLQFGLFKDFGHASQLRLSLLLAGVETEVEKNDDKEHKMYRVQQGPYGTSAQAKIFQQKWQKKGIESIIKKGESIETI